MNTQERKYKVAEIIVLISSLILIGGLVSVFVLPKLDWSFMYLFYVLFLIPISSLSALLAILEGVSFLETPDPETYRAAMFFWLVSITTFFILVICSILLTQTYIF